MPKCSKCGKNIKFIHSEGKNIILNPAPRYYITTGERQGELFIMENGKRNFGFLAASDGIKGYKLHDCFR